MMFSGFGTGEIPLENNSKSIFFPGNFPCQLFRSTSFIYFLSCEINRIPEVAIEHVVGELAGFYRFVAFVNDFKVPKCDRSMVASRWPAQLALVSTPAATGRIGAQMSRSSSASSMMRPRFEKVSTLAALSVWSSAMNKMPRPDSL